MNRLAHLLNQERIEQWKKHIKEEPKWLFEGMTKYEIRNGYEEVQRELKEMEK